MKSIGMPGSPFVRPAAISLHSLGLRFEHCRLCVFRTFTAFERIDAVVEAASFEPAWPGAIAPAPWSFS